MVFAFVFSLHLGFVSDISYTLLINFLVFLVTTKVTLSNWLIQGGVFICQQCIKGRPNLALRIFQHAAAPYKAVTTATHHQFHDHVMA